jgi:hypothetical protein
MLGGAKLYLGDTGMRGYDFPALIEFLEIHGTIFLPRFARNSEK